MLQQQGKVNYDIVNVFNPSDSQRVHVARLKAFKWQPSSQLEAEDQAPAKSDEYEVEAILDDRLEQPSNSRSYLVKWRGWTKRYNSWVKESDLHSPDLLAQYSRSKQQTPVTTKGKSAVEREAVPILPSGSSTSALQKRSTKLPVRFQG